MPAVRPVVRLYGRDGCHLCEDAEAALRALSPGLGFDIELVDIEADDELHRRYLFEIPVIAMGERELLRAPFSRQTLADVLSEALAAT